MSDEVTNILPIVLAIGSFVYTFFKDNKKSIMQEVDKKVDQAVYDRDMKDIKSTMCIIRDIDKRFAVFESIAQHLKEVGNKYDSLDKEIALLGQTVNRLEENNKTNTGRK